MEFTTEQQAHIDALIAEKTDGLFTEDDLNKKVTSEVDRRVESGIRKGLETQKSKWQEEYEEKAKMSAEELAKLSVKEQVDTLAKREAELNKRSNRIDAIELFSKANIAEEDYSKFMDLLISDDVDSTQTNVTNFIESLVATRDNIEKTVKEKLSNIPSPKGGEDKTQPRDGVQDFMAMAQAANIRQ